MSGQILLNGTPSTIGQMTEHFGCQSDNLVDSDVIALFCEDEHKKLERIAYVDRLTNVFNLAGFSREGKKLVSLLYRFEGVQADIARNNQGVIKKIVNSFLNNALLKRKTDGAAYLFIDLDGFKEINDKLGHDAGDKVLQEIATLILNRTRPNDIVGRIGGDEFGVLVRIQNTKDLESFSADLQKILDNHYVEYNGKKIKATGTIGYKKIDMNNYDPREEDKKNNPIAIAKAGADADMYEKKRLRYADRTPR